jgi:hypothetical protein
MKSNVIESFPPPSPGLLYRLILPKSADTVMVTDRGMATRLPDFRSGEFNRLLLGRLPRRAGDNLEEYETVHISSLKASSVDCVIAQDVFGPATAAADKNYRGAELLGRLHVILTDRGLLLLPGENLLAPRNVIRSIQDLLVRRPRMIRKTYLGYLTVLRATGFRNIATYAVAPSYDYPLYMVACQYRAARRFFIMEASSSNNTMLTYIVKYGLAICGISPYIQHSFLFVSQK